MSLLLHVFKLFMTVIKNWITNNLDNNQSLDLAEFKNGFFTMESILTIQQLVEILIEKNITIQKLIEKTNE